MKFYIKSLIFILLTTALILAEGEGIILINKSGTKLICEKENLEGSQETVLENNSSTFLANMGEDMLLSIKSVGKKPLYKDLSSLISSINAESLLYPNQNAIITIHFKGLSKQWTIDVSWRHFNVYEFLKDVLGEDYAQKAKEIELYDYSEAVANGFIDLFNALSKEINNTNMEIYEKSSRRKGIWIAPDPATLEDLKASIDRLYRALQRYKTRENKINI